MSSVLGVGILGAGPVTQAIHLPVLATVPERFRIVHVMDVDARVAEVVAARCGASATTSTQQLLSDPAVDVVAICSPNDFHCEQVVAACAAGKKAILCEKPLAVSEAESMLIRDAVEKSGAFLLVGTMHAFDPAYRAAHDLWRQTGDAARLVRSSIYLPSNDVFIAQATDQFETPGSPQQQSKPDLAFKQRMFRLAMLGLAIHNVPLIRDFRATPGELKEARYVAPFGYSATWENAGAITNIQALMPGKWPAKWKFRALGERHELAVDFPPSYVLAGSASARVTSAGLTREFAFSENGYQAQWKHLYEVVMKGMAPLVSLDAIVADLLFALDLADRGSASLGAGS